MKILHFSPSSPGDDLGTGRRLEQLLLNDGHEHFFLAPAAGGRAPDRAWRSRENLSWKRCRYIFRLPPEIPVVTRYLKVALNRRLLLRAAPPAKGFDLVAAHTPLDFALPALNYARRNRLPLVYEIHTLYYDGVADRRRRGVPGVLNRLAKRLSWLGERTLVRGADAVILQTRALKDRVVSLYRVPGEKVRVVPNGIDPGLFRPLSRDRREQCRREFGWEGKTVILYSGYLDWVNGVDFLLREAAALPAARKRFCRLVIAGGGPLAGSVRRAAAAEPGFIEYPGRIDHRRMPELYGAADLFVIPRPDTPAADSLVPIKLLEAMAMGKAVLASDLAAFREVIEPGVNGALFRREDGEDFRVRLLELLADPENPVRMGTRARRTVTTRYSWGRSREILAGVFRQFSSGKGGGER